MAPSPWHFLCTQVQFACTRMPSIARYIFSVDDLSPVAIGHIMCSDMHNLADTTKEGLKIG